MDVVAARRLTAWPLSAGHLTRRSTRPLVEVLAPGTTVVGVRFHPGAAPSMLGLPASELVDLTLETDELWGRAAVALGELLDAAASPEEALDGLQRHIVGRIADAPAPDRLVAEAVGQLRWRTDDVGSLTSSLHISERQLRRRCQAAVGLAPKALQRMLRFQGFLTLAQHAIAQGKAPDDGLALLAAEAGYADQPHLNRECMRLTGVSPRAFLGEAEHTCACGHDHAVSFSRCGGRARGPTPARRPFEPPPMPARMAGSVKRGARTRPYCQAMSASLSTSDNAKPMGRERRSRDEAASVLPRVSCPRTGRPPATRSS
jgi:AraC-like DNA-binding protein